jgi:hypothetical protein
MPLVTRSTLHDPEEKYEPPIQSETPENKDGEIQDKKEEETSETPETVTGNEMDSINSGRLLVPETVRNVGTSVSTDPHHNTTQRSARLASLACLIPLLLLWTMPSDKDPYLRARLVGRIEYRADSMTLADFDSLPQGAPESSWVNPGCIHEPQHWTFWIIVYDSTGNPSVRSNLLHSTLLP